MPYEQNEGKEQYNQTYNNKRELKFREKLISPIKANNCNYKQRNKKYKSNITTTIEGNSLQEIIWHIYNPSSLKVEK